MSHQHSGNVQSLITPQLFGATYDVDMASRSVVAASTASLFVVVALFVLLSNQEDGQLFPSGAPQSALVSRGDEVLEPSVKNGLIVPSLAKVESATKLLYSIPKSSDCRRSPPLRLRLGTHG